MKNNTVLSEFDACQRSSLSLAFIGDSIWEIMCKLYFFNKGEDKIANLHKNSSQIIKAGFQALALDFLYNNFTEREEAVATRAKNVKFNTIPKNASAEDYRKSTMLEAVIGFNYLTGNEKRIEELFTNALCLLEE